MLNFRPLGCLGWLEQVFGSAALTDVEERGLRFAEEVIELGQADGITREQHHALVDQVHDKQIGDQFQELGGVLVTLATYLAVTGQDPNLAFNSEFDRVWDPAVIAKIQKKHKEKFVVSSRYR